MQSTVESSSFPLLGGIGRFVPNPRLPDLTDKFDKLRDEFRDDSGAMVSLTDGLNRLRENTVQLDRADARDVISRSHARHCHHVRMMPEVLFRVCKRRVKPAARCVTQSNNLMRRLRNL